MIHQPFPTFAFPVFLPVGERAEKGYRSHRGHPRRPRILRSVLSPTPRTFRSPHAFFPLPSGFATTGTADQPGAYVLRLGPALRESVTYTGEVSADLAPNSWTSAGVTHTRLTTGDPETWQISYPASASRVFLRLRVSLP